MDISNETQTAFPNDASNPSSAEPTARRGVGTAIRELAETLILTLVVFLLIRFALPNFRIEGFSMEPNFHDGQYLFVNKLEYFFHPPERGDVVVFLPPNSTTRDFIKRIIGLPGERVEILDGVVFINGKKLDEPYPLTPGTYSLAPVLIGEDEYFVLGDNRNNSSDSHSWGTLPGKKMIGKAWISYWPPELMGFVPTFTFAAAK